jgi:hypothetical protein
MKNQVINNMQYIKIKLPSINSRIKKWIIIKFILLLFIVLLYDNILF